MSNVRTEEIRSFLNEVSERITAERYDDVAHYLREEEWQLAVRMLAEYLDERDSKLNTREWDRFAEIAQSVRLDPTRFSWLRAKTTREGDL